MPQRLTAPRPDLPRRAGGRWRLLRATAIASSGALLACAAAAQAMRCTDPATGKVLYTDQPCAGGAVVVPRRTDAELREDAAAAAAARARAERRADAALEREQQRLDAAQRATQSAAAAATPSAADGAACRTARAEAAFRAAAFSSSDEEIRTARYNAALACGQQPPADVVVVQPEPAWSVRRPHGYGHARPPYGWPGGPVIARPAPPAAPTFAPGTEPIPARRLP